MGGGRPPVLKAKRCAGAGLYRQCVPPPVVLTPLREADTVTRGPMRVPGIQQDYTQSRIVHSVIGIDRRSRGCQHGHRGLPRHRHRRRRCHRPCRPGEGAQCVEYVLNVVSVVNYLCVPRHERPGNATWHTHLSPVTVVLLCPPFHSSHEVAVELTMSLKIRDHLGTCAGQRILRRDDHELNVVFLVPPPF